MTDTRSAPPAGRDDRAGHDSGAGTGTGTGTGIGTGTGTGAGKSAGTVYAGVPTGLIGVVHLPPLPGDALFPDGGDAAAPLEAALRDAEALVRGGVDALLVENFGSAPFHKGTAEDPAPPHHTAFLAVAARALTERFDLPVGVNVLRNAVKEALAAAVAASAAFVRVNVHVGAYLTDQGLIEGTAAETLRYRRQLGAERVAICADVLVKHAAPLVPIDPELAAHDTVDRGLADALVVTGAATGAPVDPALLERVRAGAGRAPVLVGSGLTPETAARLAPLCEGAIVGTWLKREGQVRAPVEEARVRRLVEATRGRFRPQARA